ncbi:diguanylate cyclase, partial [bacterium]|nr:diguanylate cyclase [bacterium]
MQNRQSITQRITLINILLVTAGILSAFIIDSWVLHKQTTRQAEKQLDEQIGIIANSLIAPLWSFNHEAIEVFGDAFTANEEVVKLEVYSTGVKEPVYTKRKQNSDDIVSKTADIRYKDEVIGQVKASIALTSYKSVFFNHLLFGTVTTFFVAALVIFGIRYFVKRVLNTPLHTLTSWTNDVAEGKFVGSPNEIHTTELLPVATKFQHMAERIHDREAELRKLSKATEHSPACIIITDHNEQIEYVNAAFEKVTGYSRQEVIGKRSRYLLKSGGFFSAKNRSPMRGKRFWQGEIWNERKDGTPFAVLLTVSSIENTEGKTTNYIGAFSDITQLKEQQRALELIAHYDVLTQLPNRVLFADRFKQAVAHCKRTDTMLAVCFIDLDNFKPVNDQHGHKVGDQLLVEVARRIKASIREEDTVSRQGGDEFALLLQGLESFL